MAPIEAIIFDWGGVLIDDPGPGLMRYCAEALEVSTREYADAHERFAEDFQRGLIKESVFWRRVCGSLKKPLPASDSLWGDAFRAVYRPRQEVFELVGRLRGKGYKTGLLSNTEEPAMEFFDELGYEMFDTAVFSCAEGSIKPEPQIYRVAVARLNTEPGRAVLIDDKPAFVQGAKSAGLHGIIVETFEQSRQPRKGSPSGGWLTPLLMELAGLGVDVS